MNGNNKRIISKKKGNLLIIFVVILIVFFISLFFVDRIMKNKENLYVVLDNYNDVKDLDLNNKYYKDNDEGFNTKKYFSKKTAYLYEQLSSLSEMEYNVEYYTKDLDNDLKAYICNSMLTSRERNVCITSKLMNILSNQIFGTDVELNKESNYYEYEEKNEAFCFSKDIAGYSNTLQIIRIYNYKDMTIVTFYLDGADPNDIYSFIYKLSDKYTSYYLYSYMHGDFVTPDENNIGDNVKISDITGEDDGGVYYDDENYMGSD